MSQKLKIAELIPHRDNDYFFDDIQGEAWQEFINSVKTSGVIEPIVVTPVKREDGGTDKVIVSGHQRVRACKELGIEEVNAEVMLFDSEDEILKCLIETNIRQRGIGNTNPIKFGRCLKELERIYGVRDGSAGGTGANQYTKLELNNSGEATTQEGLADQLGISADTIRNYKQLADAIPEIRNLVETGIVTPTTARAIVKRLPEFQQRELAEQLADNDGKVSKREVQKYIDKIRELESREREVKTVVKEVVPEDYREAKSKAKAYDAETRRLNQKLTDAYNEQNELKEEIRNLQEQTVREQTNNDFVAGAIYFTAQCGGFIRDVGGYVWIADKLADLPERDRVGYIKAAMAVRDWATVLLQNIERSEYGKQEIERIGLEGK